MSIWCHIAPFTVTVCRYAFRYNQEYDVDRKRLMVVLTAERDRQRQKLMDRLHHKMEQKKSELDVLSPKRGR